VARNLPEGEGQLKRGRVRQAGIMTPEPALGERVVAVVGVPFDGYGRDGHQARAARSLVAGGLLEAVAAAGSRHLDLPPPDPRRGPVTSLMNEPALLAQTSQLADLVESILSDGAFPLVVGGDCTTLLGTLQGVKRHRGSVGAVVFDGHEDTIPLDVSEDGEAANTEIGILLGVTGRGLGAPLVGSTPTLAPDRLALLGARDDGWRRRFNVGSVAGLGAFSADVSVTSRAPGETAAAAVRFVGSDGWWLHVDVDVLDPVIFPAQGLPGVPDEPGGLTVDQLHIALRAATGSGGCAGMSVAIYDPEQDPDGTCGATVIDLIAGAVRALR